MNNQNKDHENDHHTGQEKKDSHNQEKLLKLVAKNNSEGGQAADSQSETPSEQGKGIKRIVLLGLANILIVAGLILLFTPLPGGGFILALGLMFLICTSEWAAVCIRVMRSRANGFNKGMTWLEDRMGENIGGALRRTRPL